MVRAFTQWLFNSRKYDFITLLLFYRQPKFYHLIILMILTHSWWKFCTHTFGKRAYFDQILWPSSKWPHAKDTYWDSISGWLRAHAFWWCWILPGAVSCVPGCAPKSLPTSGRTCSTPISTKWWFRPAKTQNTNVHHVERKLKLGRSLTLIKSN